MNTPSFRKILIGAGVAAALGVHVGAFAQATESSQPKADSETLAVTTAASATAEGIQPANTYLSSNLIGTPVAHPGEQDPSATLRQLVVDNTGNVAYVILGYGGLAGVGEKQFIVPFSALSFTEVDGTLTGHTSMRAQEVQAIPEFRTQEQTSADAKPKVNPSALETASEAVGEVSQSVGAAVGEAVTETQRVASDSWITTKVKSEIYADDLGRGYDVSVKTLHGVVALTGSLANQAAIDRVKDIAAKVKGVKSVETSALTIQ